VMLHRAILGSLERFIGILIENHAGALPLWLAPRQVAVAGITNDQEDYVHALTKQLNAAGFKAESDTRAEKISYKIRELAMQKIPYIAVVGAKEKENGTVAVRARDGKDLGVMSVAAFMEMLAKESKLAAKRE
jgi:threonyl-tRNA synthetase